MTASPFRYPKKGYVVRVAAVGEYSGHAADPSVIGLTGEVVEVSPSMLPGDWLSVVLALDNGHPFVCEQCRVAPPKSKAALA